MKFVGNFIYFGAREHKIARINMLDLEEKIIFEFYENNEGKENKILDFLVDDNQTITYLTSGGELRQENPDNSTIQKTCVNLNQIPQFQVCLYWNCLHPVNSGTVFQDSDLFLTRNCVDTVPPSNILVLSDRHRFLDSLVIEVEFVNHTDLEYPGMASSSYSLDCYLLNFAKTFVIQKVPFVIMTCNIDIMYVIAIKCNRNLRPIESERLVILQTVILSDSTLSVEKRRIFTVAKLNDTELILTHASKGFQLFTLEYKPDN